MPDSNFVGMMTGKMPIATYTATYQINSGTAIAAGASVTENVTFTGLATTDKEFGISARDAITDPTVWPKGLSLASAVISATNTLTLTWKNTTANSITPPASATWTCVVIGNFSY